jgi:hypothetical protein
MPLCFKNPINIDFQANRTNLDAQIGDLIPEWNLPSGLGFV